MRIGPFVIERRLGRGGMAEVFAGRHEGQGVDVAVKLLRVHDHAHAALLTTAFRREAERLAALDHPSIVTVLDAGVLPSVLAPSDGGAHFEAGTPYFVMERATRSLDALGRTLTWREAVDVARALLDALAHAHARGFVHRDLKPGNVLLHEEPGARSAIQLGDFGIAHTLDDVEGVDGLREGLVGTPGFMAPEQIRGAFRDLGPWTDLYALGVTLHVLLTGSSPFAAPTPHQTLVAQLTTRVLPSLPAALEAPPALQELLFAATQVDPARRLRRAADAARLLHELGRRSPVGPRIDHAALTSQPTLAALAPTSSLGQAITLRLAEVPSPTGPSASLPPPASVDDVPVTWRTAASPPPRLALIGAGLSLYGVRAIPLAGRAAERDLLWRALTRTVRDRRASLCCVRGPSGVGKTRLVQWLAVRAHELGVADVVVARHGPERGAHDGLRPALVRHFACHDLDEGELAERLRALLGLDDPFDLATVVRYLAPAARPGVRAATDAGSDLHALRLLLRASTARRPWVVVVDDVQWADEAAAAIEALLDEDLAVLFVVTEQEGASSSSSRALQAIERALAAHDGPLLQLEPLTDDEHHKLVEELLYLEPSLARRIALRTAGNPLFAVELVGDWVRRGKLVVGPHGFELAPGAGFELPDDLHAVWLERADRLLRDDGPRGDALLELAAMLGVRVALDEWRRAAVLAGLEGVDELAERLLREGLFVRESEAPIVLRFVHGLLRESVLRRAREQGRADDLSRAVARLLEEEAQRGAVGASERVARHYVSYPSLGDAHPWLLRAASDRRTACEFAGALALLDEASVLSPESIVDARTAPASILRSWTLRLRNDLPGALVAAERLLSALDRPDLAPFAADARLRRADVDVRVGRMDRAFTDLELAKADFLARGDFRGAGIAIWVRAWIDMFRGALDAPIAALTALRGPLELPHAAPPGATHVLWTLAYAYMARGDLDDATTTYADAEEAATRFRNRLAIAHVRAGQSQIARLRGNPADALALAETSVSIFGALGASEMHFGELAHGLALADLGRLDEAVGILEASVRDLDRGERTGFAARAATFCALVRIRAGDDTGGVAELEAREEALAEACLRDALLAREALVARACTRDPAVATLLTECADRQLAAPFFGGALPPTLRPIG